MDRTTHSPPLSMGSDRSPGIGTAHAEDIVVFWGSLFSSPASAKLNIVISRVCAGKLSLKQLMINAPV